MGGRVPRARRGAGTIVIRRFRPVAWWVGLASWLLVVPARASSGVDFSDPWWTPSESGWGATIHQQGDVLVIGLLVYDAGGQPIWLTAAASLQGTSVEGEPFFVGDLYRSTGSRFDAPFDARAVMRRQVGTLTFEASGADRASLTYTIDGVVVTKSIERLLWRVEDFAGRYNGAFDYDVNPLHGPCIGGRREELGAITVTQARDGRFALLFESPARRCMYSGDYRQSGRLGSVQGRFDCSDGSGGTMVLEAMTRTADGITGRLRGTDVLCEYVGRFGGVAR
jgi:hypothetical protein